MTSLKESKEAFNKAKEFSIDAPTRHMIKLGMWITAIVVLGIFVHPAWLICLFLLSSNYEKES